MRKIDQANMSILGEGKSFSTIREIVANIKKLERMQASRMTRVGRKKNSRPVVELKSEPPYYKQFNKNKF